MRARDCAQAGGMGLIGKWWFDRCKRHAVAPQVGVGRVTLAWIASTRIKREIKPVPAA